MECNILIPQIEYRQYQDTPDVNINNNNEHSAHAQRPTQNGAKGLKMTPLGFDISTYWGFV